MLIHIVKQGDNLRKICDGYHVLKEDIISNNQHITDFNHLIAGMKIKIPLLSKDIMETLEETESFIEDYYPSFDKFLVMSKNMMDDKTNKKMINIQLDDKEIEETVLIEEAITKEEISYEVPKKIEKEIVEIPVMSINSPEKIIAPKSTPDTTKKQVAKPQPYSPYYQGNVPLEINEKFIRKI